ncbi:MAG: DUF5119 domain-containing protein [Bacteroidaceae bacterium]|nr:DUF5119 domain-containing protein [Bacteroidaceae bacterium]
MNKRSLTTLRALPAILTLLLTLSTCERRPLEVVTPEYVQVTIVNDWLTNYYTLGNYDANYRQMPTGMTVMLWGENSQTPIVESRNSDRITVNLPVDRYRLIIFNQTFSDFHYQSFFEANSYENMVMRANRYANTTGWDSYVTDYMHYPDPIGVSLDTFDISQDMVDKDTTIFVFYDDYLNNGPEAYAGKTYRYEIPEVSWPMTVLLYIKAKIKHILSIKKVEACISGMADGFYFSQIRRTTETGSLKLTGWVPRLTGDPADSLGYITDSIASFGLPYGKELIAERDSADNILTFNITLRNDSVVQYTYKVAKDMHYIKPDGTEARIRYRQDLQNIRLEIELPEVIYVPDIPTPNPGAGFDAKVDPWEDGGTFEFGGF